MPSNHQPIPTNLKLTLFKWLLVFVPSVAIVLGHFLPRHSGDGLAMILLVIVVVVTLAHLFTEAMFRILRSVQAEATAREQDVRTLNAVMHERERLSRELHDGVAQLVAQLLLRLDTIKELVATGRQLDAEAELERLHEVADEIYEDIGESITGIRTNVSEQGLTRALRDYADQFEERHTIPIHLKVDPVAEQLSQIAAFQVFRFVQEALTNVRKHAAAEDVSVTITSEGQDRLTVVIADDGRGFVTDQSKNGKYSSLGLTSMRERIETLGGTFAISGQPGVGTQVSASIPVPLSKKENENAASANSAG